MSTNIPLPSITDAGIQLPTVNAVTAGAWADLSAATGGKVVQTDASTQGQLVNSLSALAVNVNDQMATLASQFNPDTATDAYLDDYGAIYGVTRKSALPTVVSGVAMTGEPFLPVPAGSIAGDIYGNLYSLNAQVTFDATGNATGVFSNLVTGAIVCPPNTLTKIKSSVPGWLTVNNPTAGAVGRDIEPRLAYRQRQRDSLYIGGRGSIEALRAAIANINDVSAWFVWHNTSDDPITYGSTAYTLAPHSVVVSVHGGTDAEIAQAMLSKLHDSVGMNGNTTVEITDTAYQPPQPVYSFKFLRSSQLRVYMKVTVLQIGTLPPDYITQVRNQMVAAFNGVIDGQRENSGATISVSKYYTAAFSLQPNIYVQTITVGTSADPTGNLQTVGIDQWPSLDPTDIHVITVAP